MPVSVIEIRGDKVRLGIEAPSNVSVYRKETFDAMRPQVERAPVSPEPPVSEHHIQVPTPPSSQVALTERQTVLIDRFRTSIQAATSTEPSREDAINVLFQAFEKAESNLALFLFDAIRDRREL